LLEIRLERYVRHRLESEPKEENAGGEEDASSLVAVAGPADGFELQSELVGRKEELSSIAAAISKAVEFRTPQLVTVIGNQGTGKSRLLREAVAELGPGIQAYRGHASKDQQGRYLAIKRLLRDRFGISESADLEGARRAFRSEVEAVFKGEGVDEVLHVLGDLLDLPFPDSPFLRVLAENPQQYDEIRRTVLRRFIEIDSHRQPLVLAFDDLQWAHDDTLALLQELAASLGGSAVVLLVASRPELLVRADEWGDGLAEHLRIDLSNLSIAAADTMFRNLLAPCGQAPQELVEDAVEMTGGNPYFLKQLVRLFQANGTIVASEGSWVLDADRALETDLPISVEEAIEARIASLAPHERDFLEKGAIFGNVFWVGAVVALTRLERVGVGQETVAAPAGPLDYDWSIAEEGTRRRVLGAVDEMVERDYLLRLDPEDSSISGDTELVFKHNLERELIAQSTEAKKRVRYYRLAAQWLESSLGERSEGQMEFLAQLHERGGDQRRAALAYLDGADRARARYSNESAIELYGKALSLLDHDDGVAALNCLHNLGSVLDLVGRTAEAQKQFTLMLRRAWLFDHRAKGGAAHSRLGRIHRRLGEYDQAMAHLRTAHELFTAASDQRGIAGALDDIGQIHWMRGAYAQALGFHRQALAIRRALGDQRSIALSLANIGRVHHETGAFKAATRQFREALELRRGIDDKQGVVQSLCDLGGVYAADSAYPAALELFEEARSTAAGIGDRLALGEVLSRLGDCLAAQGRATEAIEVLMEGVSVASDIGHRVALSDSHRRLSEVFLGMGDGAQALDHANRALEIGMAVGSRLHIGTAHRATAEAIFFGGNDAGHLARADEHFRKAVEILAGMKNELELARCYRAYAKHRSATGNTAEADKLTRRAGEIFARLHGASSVE
jgi:tetratricopeptide (TPR) repeat protein